MTISIFHTKVVTRPNNPAYQVSRNAWNDAHSIALSAGTLLGNSTGSPGAEEITPQAPLKLASAQLQLSTAAPLQVSGGNLGLDIGTGLALVAGALAAVATVANFKITNFGSSGTYTPDAKLLFGVAIAKGAGGAGGTATGGSSFSIGAGGGGEGGMGVKFFRPADVGGSVTVTVAPATSGNGATSSFGSLATGGGGVEGGNPSSGPGGGGTGDWVFPGAPGGAGQFISDDGVAATAGAGGGSGGGYAQTEFTIGGYFAGIAGISNTGGGGSGGGLRQNGGSINGGQGGSGYVLVIEFLSP